MKIGLIGFGKVSQNLMRLIQSDNMEFITSDEKRSSKTVENIKMANVEILDDFIEVARESDILISANSPANALEVAEKYGKYVDGIYLDLNNVSPDTTLKISKHARNLVDGAIIGKIDSKNPLLYLSGEKSDELLFLNDHIETVKISDRIGDASILKMIRSSYTKSVSALLIESYGLAQKYGLDEEFFNTLNITEGNDFSEKSLSRIQNTLKSKKRKSEELNEIINYFEGEDLIMVKAALERLSR